MKSSWGKWGIVILATILASLPASASSVPSKKKSEDAIRNAKEIAAREAEIARHIEDYNKHRKIYISPRTQEPAQAAYYKQVMKIIERTGTENWPAQDGKKLYGEGVAVVEIAVNGALPEEHDSVRIERSTGNPVLDQQMIEIIRSSAPFPALPKKSAADNAEANWVLIFSFKFPNPAVRKISLNLKDYDLDDTNRYDVAEYITQTREKIQETGALLFPRKDGERLNGSVEIYCPISQDGTIYKDEGGLKIRRSSDDKDLDLAVLNIIERAAPFNPIPPSTRIKYGKFEVWEARWRISFWESERKPFVTLESD